MWIIVFKQDSVQCSGCRAGAACPSCSWRCRPPSRRRSTRTARRCPLRRTKACVVCRFWRSGRTGRSSYNLQPTWSGLHNCKHKLYNSKEKMATFLRMSFKLVASATISIGDGTESLNYVLVMGGVLVRFGSVLYADKVNPHCEIS